MGRWVPEFSKKKTIFISILMGLSAFLVLTFTIQNYYEQVLQDEILETTESYMVFQTELENRINSKIYLLNGYIAYLKTKCGFDWRQSPEYLSTLMEGQDVYIRNIATILDTTIVNNYPLEGNEESIGIDLSIIGNQKEMVLKTKNERITTFQGPVPLVQGGDGFIVRMPVVKEDSGYWGQVSIVIEGINIYETMDELAEKTSLNIRIFNSEENLFYIYDEKPMKEPLSFVINPTLMNWRVEVTPINGWNRFGLTYILMEILWFLGSMLIGLLSYYSLKANYRFKHNSIHDSLTGLLNRHFLKDYQELVLSAAERKNAMVGLLLLDLDGFKSINDTYGHVTGDEVLIETARILKKVVRTNEAVFRVGGDEFLIIFPLIENALTLRNAGKRIMEMFQDEFKVKNQDIKVASSIGMGIYPIDGKNFEEVLQVADKKMYDHKKTKDYED